MNNQIGGQNKGHVPFGEKKTKNLAPKTRILLIIALVIVNIILFFLIISPLGMLGRSKKMNQDKNDSPTKDISKGQENDVSKEIGSAVSTGKASASSVQNKSGEKNENQKEKQNEKQIEDSSEASSSKETVSGGKKDTGPATVEYTVISRDEEGNILDKEIKEGTVGETITEEAKTIEGYVVNEDSESMILTKNKSDNVITFRYSQEVPAVRYTIRYLDEGGDVFETETYLGEEGDSFTLSAPYLDGYKAYPVERDVVLVADEDENVFDFFYEKDTYSSISIPDYSVLHYDGHTYYACRTSGIDSFWEAADYANSCGGYLAVITDDGENTAVYDYVFKDLGYDNAYFGLTDDGSEGEWGWIDGTEYSYENWAGGQPDNRGVGENYALFWYGDRDYKWNDGDFGKDSAGTVTFLIEWDVE